jgi:hypothetical protein
MRHQAVEALAGVQRVWEMFGVQYFAATARVRESLSSVFTHKRREFFPDPDSARRNRVGLGCSGLGTLTFRQGRWWAATPAGVPLVFGRNRKGSDPELRIAAAAAIRNLREIAARSGQFLAAEDDAWAGATPSAIEILRPNATWLRNTITDHPAAVDAYLRGAPAIVLVFKIPNDRNVVDIVVFEGTPVGLDYH